MENRLEQMKKVWLEVTGTTNLSLGLSHDGERRTYQGEDGGVKETRRRIGDEERDRCKRMRDAGR